ncbi:MAG: YbfB/YjiJ family MFS transporter [Betaproteobacteria bacterium]|nr:YbfB/YjiJ family MFS transporter [Betaproteobacteria bacterium]
MTALHTRGGRDANLCRKIEDRRLAGCLVAAPIWPELLSISPRAKASIAGIIGLLITLGIARFAYTPMLPIMREQAGLGLGAGGWLATANYLGYFSGVFLCGRINDLNVKDRIYRWGLMLAVASTAMMGLFSNELGWAISRFLAGLSTAFGMMLGGALVMNWLMRNGYRAELGVHFSGVGLSVVMSSFAVLILSEYVLWQQNWLLLSLLGLVLVIPAWAWLPKPMPAPAVEHELKMQDHPPTVAVRRLLLAFYFCAGVGFVVTSTFIVAIVNALADMEDVGFWIFVILGAAAAPSCMLWDLIARRVGAIDALLLASVIHIAGILLPLAGGGLFGPIAGALCFGVTFAGIVSMMMGLAGRFYPTRPAKMMSTLTIAYGVAQILAPALTGWMSERTGSYNAGLLVAAAVMTVGLVMLFQLRGAARLPDEVKS